MEHAISSILHNPSLLFFMIQVEADPGGGRCDNFFRIFHVLQQPDGIAVVVILFQDIVKIETVSAHPVGKMIAAVSIRSASPPGPGRACHDDQRVLCRQVA